MEIWINPNCSKRHSALSLLDAEGARYTLRNYLETPPTTLEIEEVLRRLGLELWDIARVGEPLAVELGLAKWPRAETDRIRWIETLAAHPILIQRPIITADDGTAVVGRSPDSVRSVLP
jgi:arsenate reductase